MSESRFCFSAEIFNKEKGNDKIMDMYQKRKMRAEKKDNN